MRVSTLLLFGCLICSSIPPLRAQQEEKLKLDGGMPNRISMNVTVASTNKRSINDAKKGILNVIKIDMTEEGCRVLFPDTEFKINMEKLTIAATPAEPSARVQAGLQQAGSALAQGAQLVGGALPGGSIISAAVSSVSSLSGSGGGAAAASYAATGRQQFEPGLVYPVKDDDCNAVLDLPDGNYTLDLVLVKASSGLKDTLKTQVKICFTKTGNVLKTKHDTAKNSIGNIR